MEGIYIIGAGSWGTAFSYHLARKGIKVKLWVREKELFEKIKNERENTWFLPGFKLNEKIEPFNDLSLFSEQPPELTFLAVPTKYMRSVLRKFPARPKVVVNLSKGIEVETLARMSEVIREELGMVEYAVLSGPTFALEVAEGNPTVVVVASKKYELAKKVQEIVSDQYLRAYTSDDVLGVELCGAVKNVIAIAGGAVEGLGFGHNTLAALIVRGIAEMKRIANAMGANPETISGIAGVGDLVLTATGNLSRNRKVGYELGKGKSLKEVLSSMKMVAEGIETSKAIVKLAGKYGVEMPISEKMVEVVFGGKNLKKALKELMTRKLKMENE